MYLKFQQPASRFALVGVFVAQTAGGVRVAVTGAASGGVFRHAGLESALLEWAKQFPATDRFAVFAKPYRRKRSNDQNEYYRGVVVPSVVKWAETKGYGWSDDDAHSWLKVRFDVDI